MLFYERETKVCMKLKTATAMKNPGASFWSSSEGSPYGVSYMILTVKIDRVIVKNAYQNWGNSENYGHSVCCLND